MKKIPRQNKKVDGNRILVYNHGFIIEIKCPGVSQQVDLSGSTQKRIAA
jgi:hypothetical protein